MLSNQMFALPYSEVKQKVISDDNQYYGQGPNLNFLRERSMFLLSPEGLDGLLLKRTCILQRRILQQFPHVSPAMFQSLRYIALTIKMLREMLHGGSVPHPSGTETWVCSTPQTEKPLDPIAPFSHP